MVKYILRGARWTDVVGGWELEFAAGTSGPRRPIPRQNVRSTIAEYCNRADVLPLSTRNWTDVDWLRYSRAALDRRKHGQSLSALDRVAIAKCPTDDLGDDLDELIDSIGTLAFDPLHDSKPCIICGVVVISSASVEFPLHHHCAWHVRRGDTCRFKSADGPDL